MLRQQAFAEKTKMLKGALHCHTTRSDGKGTPEEIIRLHYENGYDFLAITDHRCYNYQNFVPEIPLTILPGMEFDNMLFRDHGFRTFHTVCLGPAREDGNGYEQDERMDSGTAKNQEEYQPYLDEIHAKKNLTIYCHPQWSSTPARYFEKLQGNFALEIWNSGCAIECHMDTDAVYWDELLGQGQRIFGVATDDGHHMYHHCKGWVMVRAQNNINDILNALEQGAFYSSCGPEIYDFYVENNVAHIDCSPVAAIRLHSDCHPTKTVKDEEGRLTHAEFTLPGADTPMAYDYIRMTIVDKEGKHAWTNPIFLISK